MAIIHPFKGWHPKPEHVDKIACPPYDVMDTQEAVKIANNNPHNFLHVIRPEIDLPDNTPFNSDEVYEKGAENLKSLLNSEYMEQDEKPSIYIYQLETKSHTQTGIFTCASVQDYDNDVILKHELTRPDKEDDRTRHILTQQAHAEPVMFTYKDSENISFLVEKTTLTQPPFIEHTADDGVIHKLWKTDKPVNFVEAFAKLENLYIADGHHRCKSASRVSETLRKQDNSFPGEAEYDYFPVVLFPMSQMKILPYNRIIKTVTSGQFDKLKESFNLQKTDVKSPEIKGDISIYFEGVWWKTSLPELDGDSAVSTLDAARLQKLILEPVFDIQDIRTDDNIAFVGGSRGTDELEKLVDKKKADLAISMYPTGIDELVEVSDRGELMPPKSTWFEPKVKSGTIVHTF